MNSEIQWFEKPLGEVTCNHDGKRKPVKESERKKGPYPYYGASGIVDYVDGYLFDGRYLLVAEDGENLRTRQTPIAFMADGKFWVNNHAHIVTGNEEVTTEYLHYFLQHADIQSYLTGAVMPKLTQGNLNRIPVRYPELDYQKQIVQILSFLDRKIDLNRRINQSLEAMAQAIFKSWFVDFDPVKAKVAAIEQGQDPLRAAMRAISGKTNAELDQMPREHHDQLAATAALFPDAMEESELGEIPKGWDELCFGDVAQQGKGTVNPGTLPKELFTHYSLPAFDASRLPIVETGESIKSNKTFVPDGAVLLSKLNPHIPRVWLIGRPGERAVCSTEFIVWTPKAPANSAFVYGLASSPAFNSAMRQLVTGTSNSHQRVKPEQLADIRVFAASNETITQHSMSVAPLMEKIIRNREEASMLAQLRDTLLPKLLSGELSLTPSDC